MSLKRRLVLPELVPRSDVVHQQDKNDVEDKVEPYPNHLQPKTSVEVIERLFEREEEDTQLEQQPDLDPQGPARVEDLLHRRQSWDEMYTRLWSARERKQPFRYCDFYLQVMASKCDHQAMYDKYKTVLLSESLVKRLPEKLIHYDVYDEESGLTQTIPIVNYTQQRLFNLLQGLEMYIGGHLFEDDRDEKWIKEMEFLVEVIKVPLMKMIALPLSSFILSMPDYTIEVQRDGTLFDAKQAGNTSLQARMRDIGLTDADYHSDEETRAKIRSDMNRRKEYELLSTIREEQTEKIEDGDAAEEGDPSGMKDTTRRVNFDFLHDVSWMLREIEFALAEAREFCGKTQWVHTSESDRLSFFRKRAIERISSVPPKSILVDRKAWQIETQCVESLRAKQARRNKKLIKFVGAREALGPYTALFVDDYLPTSLVSMFREHPKTSLKHWVLVNTDFLFFMISKNQVDSEEGNLYDYLLRSKTIKRIRALNKYVVEFEDGWHGFSSLLEAFLFLRKHMIEIKMDPVLYFGSQKGIGLSRVNLGQLDEWFNLSTESTDF
jgi:hypothetical protein